MKQGTTMAFVAAVMLLAGSVQASDRLSCQLKVDSAGGSDRVRTTDFAWASGGGDSEVADPVETSIGRIEQGEGPERTTAIVLDGRPIEFPVNLGGVVHFGTAYDYGDRVALAYLVERAEDSTATPSQVALLIDSNGRVASTDLIPGDTDPAAGQCRLFE